ncbi:MAG TPA: PKD domain-containing protein, partial [Bacteroidia bacterium]|nr:PKD domain-containing protein [Bacteroidia bacterium]
LLLAFLFPLSSLATHIVGGTITYKHISGSSYSVTVKLYRDCSPGNVAFPSPITVMVRDVNGNQLTPSHDFSTTLDSVKPVPSYLPPCITNPGLCYEEGWYTTVLNNFNPLAGGYHIYYQICCRPSNLANVVNPLTAGMSLYAFLPDPGTTVNNSPDWDLAPPLFECQGNPMYYDYGATDADGDSLVYSYYTPYSDPNPTFPGGVATFTPITWVAGYGANNSCGGPNLTMNSTGLITGTPPNLGLYQHGVLCEEFRNGVKIAEIRRDYPFVVVSCPPAPIANFFADNVICYGSTLQVTNNSVNATTYHWDFGDPAVSNDTSNVANPSWLYANPGTYTVTLIADPNTNCADTATWAVTVEEVVADFSVSQISGLNYQFTDQTVTSDGAPIVWWSWDFGDATNSNSQNPSHIYPSAGNYTVTLNVISANGCLSTYTFTVNVTPQGLNTASQFTALHIFPNPSDGKFTIELPDGIHNAQLTITDLSGRILFVKNSSVEKEIQIDEHFSAGIYLLKLSSEELNATTRLIVQ